MYSIRETLKYPSSLRNLRSLDPGLAVRDKALNPKPLTGALFKEPSDLNPKPFSRARCRNSKPYLSNILRELEVNLQVYVKSIFQKRAN